MTLQPVATGLTIGIGSVLGAAIASATLPVWANPITPEAGSQTQVVNTGNEFTITGGALSADGQNLFHSFEAFGLSQSQIATFLTQPDVQAVLGRITGGNASYIDGLLQVTGSSADLYLINPAGIMFGPNAQLNLAGSFTAATASGIQFGDGSFNAVGTPDYNQLVGDPTGFAFAMETPAAVVNEGNLAVAPGESILLMGGQVISTGTLSAPGGEITIAAVPGESLVRISQADMVLSLELETLPDGVTAGADSLDPLSLPELLTGGDSVSGATSLEVQPDGSVELVGGDLTIPNEPGVVAVAGSLDATGDVGGEITVVGDRVGLAGATVDASGTMGGGTIRVGGAYQGGPTLPASAVTYVDSETTLAASAIENGDGGEVILWSDGITGFYGQIFAEGGANGGDGGFVEVSGLETLQFEGTVLTNATRGNVGTLLLDPTDIIIVGGDGSGLSGIDGAPTYPGSLLFTTTGLDDSPPPTYIYESQLTAATSNIVIQASGDITIEDLSDEYRYDDPYNQLNSEQFGRLNFSADAEEITFIAGGTFSMEDINDEIYAPGQNIEIDAETVNIGGINTADEFGDEASGNVEITAESISVRAVLAAINDGDERGGISLTSTSGDITVQQVIEAGAGGVTVNAARQFRVLGVIGADLFPGDSSDDGIEPTDDPEFLEFLSGDDSAIESLLIDGIAAGSSYTVLDFPVSIASNNGPIEIVHGGQVGTIGDDNIRITGTGVYPDIQFVIGPQPATPPTVRGRDISGFVPLPVGSSLFPDNVSGTVGTILRGGINNTSYYSSLQNLPFVSSTTSTEPTVIIDSVDEASEPELQSDEESLLTLQTAKPICSSQMEATDETEIDSNSRVEIVTSCENATLPDE